MTDACGRAGGGGRRFRAPALLLAALFPTALPVAAAPVDAPDPNLFLEEVSSPAARAWVAAENGRTLGILERDPRYAGLYADALRIAEARDKVPVPALVGGAVANFWQDADHVRGLWRATSRDNYAAAAPAWRTLIDLDALAAADKASWVWKGATCEPVAERRCLVKLSDGGEDAVTMREFDVPAARFVDGGIALPTSKQAAAWDGDGSVLVARDWGPGTLTTSGYPFVVRRVVRGRPLAQATEIFRGAPGDVEVEPDGYADGTGRRIVVIRRSISYFENEFHVAGATGTTSIAVPRRADLLGFVDGRLVFRINEAWAPAAAARPIPAPIPAGALVAVDPDGRAAPETIFAPGPRQAVDDAVATRTRVVAAVYDNVRGRAIAFARGADGRWAATPVALPDNASVDLLAAGRDDDRAYVATQSFLLPTAIADVDAAKGTAVRVKATPPRFEAAGLVTEQFEATSTDGTRVPYFVVHRRDVSLDGSTPTLLTAYGGFQIAITPAYSGTTGKLWLERGGAFAIANIRGGGEFGPAWHDAALKTHRQRAYDDFAAVARALIARRLTSPRRLGIYGGSNGGLLMGVEMTQHPALWNAVAIEVPLLDMMRYETLSAGSSWVGEYGSMAVPAERAFWSRVSPYQALRRDAHYPEPFIWTTTKDDRVGPAQARKFAARMKAMGLPYLYWENTEGGHGAGANLKEQAHARALEMVYFTRRLMDRQAPADPPPAPR